MIADVTGCFLLAAVVSFVGSLQPGPVNMAVMNVSYHAGFRPALWMAVGGAIPEVLYCAAAFGGSLFLFREKEFACWLSVISVPVFLLAGIRIWRRSGNVKQEKHAGIKHYPLFSGFLLGLLNPMLFAFWLLAINFFTQAGWAELDMFSNRLAFTLGTATGAFLLLLMLAWLVERRRNSITFFSRGRVDKIIGATFIIFAFTAAFRLILQP